MGFGSAYVATSFALVALGPVPAAAWRSLIATLLIAALIAVRGRSGGEGAAADRISVAAPGVDAVPAGEPAPGEREDAAPTTAARAVRLLVLSTLAGPLFLTSMNLAVAHVGAAIAAFVAGLYAVLSAVIAPALLPERLTARVLAGFVLALGGTALLAQLDPSSADLVGIGWGGLAASAFALYLVLTRRWSRRYRLDGMTVALANGGLTAIVLGGVLLATDPGSLAPTSVSASVVIALIWLGVVAAMGPVLTVASVRLIPAARSAAFLLFNPITATVLAFLLLGERPAPLQITGGVLVLLGMAAATLPGRSSRQA